MKSRASPRFWRLYQALPDNVRRQAQKAFRLWLQDSSHPSLQFKRIHAARPIYSVRVSRNWRALGVVEDDEIIWFWVGSHGDYDDLISRL
jgi:hypothetical protein